MQTVHGVKEVSNGALLVLSYANVNNENFMKYSESLKRNQNRNSWFVEFWHQQFNCTKDKRLSFSKDTVKGSSGKAKSKRQSKLCQVRSEPSNAGIGALIGH